MFFVCDNLTGQIAPVARFSFNNSSTADEINHKNAKFVNSTFAEDRFGNSNNAAFVHGNHDSYINLGNYPALKSKVGSISLWVKMEAIIYSGRGIETNPIIVTRNCSCNDYNEAYSISFITTTKKIGCSLSNDSLKQVFLQTENATSTLKWHHIVLTYNFDEASLYLNGKLQSRFGKKFESYFEPTDSVMLGLINNAHNKRVFRGSIDDLEFYDKVLNPEEVYSLYTRPNPNKNAVFFNRLFIALAVLAGIGLLYLFFRGRFNRRLAIEKQKMSEVVKQLENELRINRALMNPHFMFNSLNTLHSYILNHNIDMASDYLVKFSKLIRKILESNMHDTISLEMEIDLIERYLEIESLRFKEKIKQDIVLGPGVIPAAITIPIMMLQPFVENSIWHGLLEKPGEKSISITFSLEGKCLLCIIEDNGTGRKNKTQNVLEKKSLATSFIIQRLALLNKIHGTKCNLTIEDKPDNKGTVVRITLPILNK